MTNHDPVTFEAAAREVGFLGFGFYPRSGSIHVYLEPSRQWGERFPRSYQYDRRAKMTDVL